MRQLLTMILLAFAASAFASPIDLTPLNAGDVPILLAPPTHGERIIMLWSLDCVYCEPNMQALAKLQRAHPRRIQLVTVATDSIAQRANITKRLEAAGVQGYPARAYSEPTPARINFLIDPTWGGELPRTIVIRANGKPIAISGKLTGAQLRSVWP